MNAATGETTRAYALRGRRAFTLVEMIMAVGVSLLIVSTMAGSYLQLRRVYRNIESASRRNENLRVAMLTLERDLRMAGYGLGTAGTNLMAWFPGAGAITGRVTITQGMSSNVPDSITILGALGSVTSSLQNSITAGATSLTVAPGDGNLFNALNRNVILVGGLEMARVMAVNGDQLTVSSDAVTNGVGLKYAYRYGNTIELIENVTYACGLMSGAESQIYYLSRDEHRDSLSAKFHAIAANIDNFKISIPEVAYVIELTGRSEQADLRYVDPVYRDGYRRTKLRTSVFIRN
jgi:type II secretory pathway pseudopilin PulG